MNLDALSQIVARSSRLQRLIAIVVVVIFVIGAFLYGRICAARTGWRESPNVLQFGLPSNAPEAERSDVQNLGPTELLNLEQIIEIRELALAKFPGLLPTKYRPSPLMLEYARLDQPWESAAYRYLDGPLREAKFTAPAAEIDLANPMLLIRPEFTKLGGLTVLPWDIDLISKTYTPAMRAFPYIPKPGEIVLNRERANIEVTYNISSYFHHAREWMNGDFDYRKGVDFVIVGYNANDFGYTYLQFDPKQSSGVTATKPPGTEIAKGFWYFKFNEAGCGDGRGCNQHAGFYAPSPSPLSFTELPARAVFNLYKVSPVAGGSEDIKVLRYEILFQ